MCKYSHICLSNNSMNLILLLFVLFCIQNWKTKKKYMDNVM